MHVVIVGGGPVGLVAAHALDKAGIDYVILEGRGEQEYEPGASLAVWPHNVRLLDQLGLLDEALQTYQPTLWKRNLRRDGSLLSKSNMFEAMQINHGHPWMCFHRCKLVNMLRQRLPDPSKLHFGKKIEALETTKKGVTVTCSDGSTFSGSIVVGADGVHSTVRKLMNDAVGVVDEPFVASYRGLYGYSARLPSLASLEPATCYETHSDNMTLQLIVGEEMMHFLAYERLPKPTKERTRYTVEDEETLARSFADVRFNDNVTFGDVWAHKAWSTIANLEEGTVKQWYRGRAVLVGDAVHKMTPNSGFGMNSGLQCVAQLVNRLRRLLQTKPEPDVDTLTTVFCEYQAARMGNSAVGMAGLYTRLVAWDNPVYKLADQYVMPYINGDVTSLNLLMSPIVKVGVPLDFIEEKEFKNGKVRYVTGPPVVEAT